MNIAELYITKNWQNQAGKKSLFDSEVDDSEGYEEDDETDQDTDLVVDPQSQEPTDPTQEEDEE